MAQNKEHNLLTNDAIPPNKSGIAKSLVMPPISKE
jgi:hypothetical protein